jgi:hypothetical protein
MKKFLAPIMAIAAVASFSSAVFAEGNSDEKTIEQEGSVKGNCTLNVTNGKLPDDAGFVNSIDSTATPGQISTLCNTKDSKLTVKLDSEVTGSVNGQTITRAYELKTGTGAYQGVTQAFGAAPYSQTNIADNFSSTPSTLAVITKVSAPNGQNLAGGNEKLKVKVKATVTP